MRFRLLFLTLFISLLQTLSTTVMAEIALVAPDLSYQNPMLQEKMDFASKIADQYVQSSNKTAEERQATKVPNIMEVLAKEAEQVKQEEIKREAEKQKADKLEAEQRKAEQQKKELGFGIFVILLSACYLVIKKLGCGITIKEYVNKSLAALKETRGVKRLCVALSILYLIGVIGVAFGDSVSLGKSFQLLFVGGMPVWLNWLAYWIYLGFKTADRSSKVQFWSLIIFVLALIVVFSAGYSSFFIIVSLPVWVSWLTYWLYLGFKQA